MTGEPVVLRPWHNSSAPANTCVDTRQIVGGTQVRHSGHPDGPVLTFTTAEWDAFTAGVINGDHDSIV